MLNGSNYVKSIDGTYVPGVKYPGVDKEDWLLPEDLQYEWARLNSTIETKYSREYLKICAFYNKLFPSLRTSTYITTSYNVTPFTALEQERSDTGTGISSNYLKQIIDQVTARIGTINYEPMLIADVPTLEYIIYKDEVERQLRKMVRDTNASRVMTEMFHDAAVVCFSHEFIDPVTHKWVKANDYEIGMFESQFINGDVKQMLYRNYNFPTISLVPYLKGASKELQEEIVKETEGRDWVDFRMFFDCPGKRVVIMIHGKVLPDIPYPFDTVQMVTFGWDIGFSKVTVTSLFDLLYPCQREMNRVNNKIQQLIRLYKGAMPVFANDVDLAMKAITNGSGECLYVDSTRPLDNLMTVINPTPMDAQLSAVKTEIKTEMYELAGLQQMSFDMENFRSAAAVIAADQFNDSVFQAQMAGMAEHIRKKFSTQVYYDSIIKNDDTTKAIWQLLSNAVIELKPIVMTNPLGNKAGDPEQPEIDYLAMGIARAVMNVLKGEMTYETVPFMIEKRRLVTEVGITIVKMDALGLQVADTLQMFMISAFIGAVQKGEVLI